MASVYQTSLSLVSGRSNYWQMVFHYQLTETGSGTPFSYADSLNNAFLASNLAPLLNALSNDTMLNIISSKKVTNGGGPSMLQQPAAPGTIASPSYAGPNAADIRFFPGGLRSRLGRIYLGGVPTNAAIGDVLQGGYTGLVALFGAQMITPLTLAAGLGTATFGTFSRSTLGFVAATFQQFSPKMSALNKRSVPLI